MALKVGINGFGRIGRLCFRAGAKNPSIEFVGINDLFPPENLAYLLKHDSTHGKYKGTVEAKENGIVVDGKLIPTTAIRNPAELPWAKLGADYVVESTGLFTDYAGAPHYGLYSNAVGERYTAYFFPHDEFYDDGVNEAIAFVCHAAPPNATIASEVPGVVHYYTEKFGRTDLQSRVLSDQQYTPAANAPTYVILQRGRSYFENRQEMQEVKQQFALVYAGCIKGHTAAEVYAAPALAGVAVPPCGDARP